MKNTIELFLYLHKRICLSGVIPQWCNLEGESLTQKLFT